MMFSVKPVQQVPGSCEVYQWWITEGKGKEVIVFLSSLKEITPLLDDAQNSGRHEPNDRFMDPYNERLFKITLCEIDDLCERRERRDLSRFSLHIARHILLKRIFPEELETSDFSNYLAGLDYLSALESYRREVLRETAQRLGITEDNWKQVLAHNDQAQSWVKFILEQERQIDLYYSSLWVNLRIWSMVKELQSRAFYKPAAIAMLNTLFPPVLEELPSAKIEKNIMWHYRGIFYRFMGPVQARGKGVLGAFLNSITHPASGRDWPLIYRNLSGYIELADSMIEQALSVRGVSFFPHREQNGDLKTLRHANAATIKSESKNGLIKEISANEVSDEQKNQSPVMVETTRSAPKGYSTNTNQFEQKFIPIPRSKISGRPLYGNQNFSVLSVNNDASLGNEAALLGASATYRHSSPRHRSSPIDQGSINKGSSGVQLPQATDLLSKTPELPSPPLATGQMKAAKSYRNFHRGHGPDDDDEPLMQPVGHPVVKTEPKKSTFKLFSRKKRPTVLPDEIASGRNGQLEESWPKTPQNNFNKKFHQDSMEPLPVVPPIMKTKASFSFLRGYKSRENVRAAGERNLDRTITNAKVTPGGKLRPKGSFSNMFARKEVGMGIMDHADVGYEQPGPKTEGSLYDKTLRKVRSYGSVQSAGLPIIGGRENRAGRGFALSTACPEDRILTSADIAEPFPFSRNYVRPQSPALLFEKAKSFDYMEQKRLSLIAKARGVRKETNMDDERFRKTIEEARKKREEVRVEMDSSPQLFENKNESKNTQTPKKKKGIFGKTKEVGTPSKSSPPALPTPESGKTPKTPRTTRLIGLMANAYSPTPPAY